MSSRQLTLLDYATIIQTVDPVHDATDPLVIGSGIYPSQPVNAHASGANKPTALDFFAGSGLATLGLSSEFNVVWANDNSTKKAAVYAANHGPHIDVRSIEDIRGAGLPASALSWASFPCQDLSLAGNILGIDSGRSGLVWEWLRIIDEMPERPQVLVAENVVGLVASNGGKDYARLHAALAARGYQVGALRLDAIHWLPQSRPRVFVVAVRSDIDITCFRDLWPDKWCHPLAIQRAAALCDEFVWWRLPKPQARTTNLDGLLDAAHVFDPPARREHIIGLISPAHRARLDSHGDGCVCPGYRRIRNGAQVLELRFDHVAGCLRTPTGGSSRQLLVHRIDGELQTRLLSIREAARLMGAPDSYRIPGSYNDGYKAMGDAVAVPVVRFLSENLLSPIVMRARAAGAK